MSEHRFEVGGIYENEKGPFKVLAMKGGRMRIEWDGAEQLVTEIALQERFQERMEREARARTAGVAGSTPAWMGRSFSGLQASDFADDVTGTRWRSREQLGGAVARLLSSREPMNSWSIYRRAHVHWAAISRYGSERAWLLAKFFFSVLEEGGTFGYHVERSSEPGDSKVDWLNFVKWLAVDKQVAWLHRLTTDQGLTIFDPYPELGLSFTSTIRPHGDGWLVERPGHSDQVLKLCDLADHLEGLDTNTWVNLVIGKRCPAEELIAQGAGVASTLADCFNALMPVYESESPRRVNGPVT